MNERECSIQVYLAEREADLGAFTLKCIKSRISNIKAGAGIDNMNEREELFAKFFRDERTLIPNMNDLELEAHREELSKISFEARARLTAVDEEKRERKAKKGKGGFNVTLEPDELTTNAINKVKGVRLSRGEKLLKDMLALGMDESAAKELLSAQTVLKKLKQDKPLVIQSNLNKPEAKLVSNPFAKAPEPETTVEVTINEETNSVVIKEETHIVDPVHEQAETQTTFNPFAK